MSPVLSRTLRTNSTPLLLILVVAVVAMVTSGGSGQMDYVVVTALVNLVIVVGLYVFVGNSGVFSFGHIGFMAIGAYVAGLLSIPQATKEVLLPDLPGVLATTELSSVLAIIVGGLVAAAVAAVLAVPLMRLSGLTAALGTVAVLLITHVVGINWDAVTHGTAGITGIPTVTTRDNALMWAVVAIIGAWVFQQSRAGLRVRAARDDEVAASATGVRIGRDRGTAFVASAFLVGAGGGLFAQQIGTITPDAFYLSITFLTIAMLVVGGITTLSGAVIGTLVISALGEVLRRVETSVDRPGLREVVLALAMLVILAVRPQGLTGGREIVWPARLRRSRNGSAPAMSTGGGDGLRVASVSEDLPADDIGSSVGLVDQNKEMPR
jgi:branched-chain amino acid transport system permease protein